MAKNFKILVVDDEPAVRRGIRLLLQYDGHEVCDVEDGRGALARLGERSFDLVITDYFMPEMNGADLVARIRQLLPAQPILLISSSVQEAKWDQANAVLQKPFTIEDLRAAVRQAMRLGEPE